jgi:hypothetical protein
MNLIKNDVSRCNNHQCKKRMRCSRYLQLKIDTEDLKKEIHPLSFSVTRNEDKNCTKFIEFDDNN